MTFWVGMTLRVTFSEMTKSSTKLIWNHESRSLSLLECLSTLKVKYRITGTKSTVVNKGNWPQFKNHSTKLAQLTWARGKLKPLKDHSCAQCQLTWSKPLFRSNKQFWTQNGTQMPKLIPVLHSHTLPHSSWTINILRIKERRLNQITWLNRNSQSLSKLNSQWYRLESSLICRIIAIICNYRCHCHIQAWAQAKLKKSNTILRSLAGRKSQWLLRCFLRQSDKIDLYQLEICFMA